MEQKIKFQPFFFIYLLILTISVPNHIQAQPAAAADESIYHIRTIVLDPGHGGNKPGTVGKKSKEKDVVLDIALKLGKAIEKELPDVKVHFTRTTDVDVDIYKRTALANEKKADLFISIHCNAAPYRRVRQGNRWVNAVNTGPRGTETLVLGYNYLGNQDAALRENADILLEENFEENYQGFDPNDPESYIIFSLMRSQYREQSIKLAAAIQKEFTNMGRVDRGVKEQKLAVLMNAGMPAILTELGFLSNPEEEAYMLSEEGQDEIVKNLLDAIKTYKRQTER
ncbi:MAG TPA: N-acetylmuramoyl-L-alanine amidase [Sphingobacteriaceae bacterium]|nr:N-acetylmuramoyl-L-alanine amidase [Sphingobacteriaceae bacterium]